MNYSSEEIFGKAIEQIIHDIRNSLNIIIGYSSLIQTDNVSNNEAKEYHKRILESGTMVEKLLSSIDDYIITDLDINKIQFNVILETKNFFSKITNKDKNISVQIENLNTNPININISQELYKKLLDNLYQFSLKELRNKEQKNIQILLKKDKTNLIILYSDSSTPVYIADSYFTFEEIIESKRGLCLVFIEKYVELLNGNVEYCYGNKWYSLISKYLKKNKNSHGFIIEIPVKK